jgi:hypothetical protein
MPKKIIRKKNKPTSYQAAKNLVSVEEIVTAQIMIDRLFDVGRREIPPKRSLSALMKQDPDFEQLPKTTTRGPATFKRIA